LIQDFEEVSIIPSGSEMLGLDPGFDGMLLLEQIEGNMM
jgi:hypothetical protein